MKICVIGAGPAGLYTSKYLLSKGAQVICFEKEPYPYGLFNKCNTNIFADTIRNNNFKLFTNLKSIMDTKQIKDMTSKVNDVSINGPCLSTFNSYSKSNMILDSNETKDCVTENVDLTDKIKNKDGYVVKNRDCDDHIVASKDIKDDVLNLKEDKNLDEYENIYKVLQECDAIVIATGSQKPKVLAIDTRNICIQAIDIVNAYNNCTPREFDFKKDVIIIGCGNVAFDVVRYLFWKGVKNVTVVCRRGPFDSSFGNTELRNIIEEGNIKFEMNINLEKELLKYMKERERSAVNDMNTTKLKLGGVLKQKHNLTFLNRILDLSSIKFIKNKLESKESELANSTTNVENLNMDISKDTCQICNKNHTEKETDPNEKDIDIDTAQYKELVNMQNISNLEHKHGVSDKSTSRSVKEERFKNTKFITKTLDYLKRIKNMILDTKKTNLCNSNTSHNNMNRHDLNYNIPTNIQRRFNMLNTTNQGNKILKMLFYTYPTKLHKIKDQVDVVMNENGKTRKSIFDTVISSIGFENSKIDDLKKGAKMINKPIYFVGWCKIPTGNLNDIKVDAFKTAEELHNTLKNKIYTLM